MHRHRIWQAKPTGQSSLAGNESLNNLHGKPVRQILALGLPTDSNSAVLDNGRGFGCLTNAIQDLLKPGARPKVHDMDVEPDWLLILELIAREQHWTCYETAVMNARHLGFPDDTFTHSFTCYAIFVIREPEVAAGEIFRTLKPGGVAVVGSTNRVDWLDGVLRDIQHVERADVLGEDYKCFLHFAEWASGEKLVEVMKKGGFRARENPTRNSHGVVAWCRHGPGASCICSQNPDVAV